MTQTSIAKPQVVDQETWRTALDDLRIREKAATRELDAIAAQRRRLPMVEMPDYTLIGEDGPVRLADVFEGKSQLIVYNHMWEDGAEWQCGGCTGFTSQFTRLDFLDNYDARFVIVTNGPDRGGPGLQEEGRQQDGLVLVVGQHVRRRRRRGARPGIRRQRVPARRRHRVPHLAHQRPRHRTAQPLVRAHRPPAVGPPGGMARLAGGLAEAADVLRTGWIPPTSRGSTDKDPTRDHRRTLGRDPHHRRHTGRDLRGPVRSRRGTRTPSRATGCATPSTPSRSPAPGRSSR